MLRRIGLLTSLAVVAVMFAGVSSARAQTGLVCVFAGLSGTLDPAIQAGIPDAGDPVPLVDVERGSYTFTSGGTTPAVPSTCGGRFRGVAVTDEVEISSNGFYDNFVCGTGTAHDLDGSGTTVTGTTSGITIGPLGYEIAFFEGVGPMRIGPPGTGDTTSDLYENLPDDPDTGDEQAHGGAFADGAYHSTTGLDSTHERMGGIFTGSGLVGITPETGNCVNEDTSQFTVAGFFVLG